MKTKWTIRVINFEAETGVQRFGLELPGIWIEQLRYMGIARDLARFESPRRTVLEFYPPKGVDAKVWCYQNASRMCSFGIDAAVAPEWGSEFSGTNNAERMEKHNRHGAR